MSKADRANEELMKDLMARIQREQEESEREGRQALAVACDRLTELGITQVHVAYNGYGDEGTVESVTAFVGEQQVELPEAISNALSEAAENHLPGGWEINDGSYGELVLDVATRKLQRQHHWRVESSEYEEEDFDLNGL